MLFEPLYHGDRLKLLNPNGDVGVATLWSPIPQALSRLERVGADLVSPNSRIAVVGNLYGDGFLAMMCNLLYNPQIRHLIALGQDLANVAPEIDAFFRLGTEAATVLGQRLLRVKGTNRFLPVLPDFAEDELRGRVSFRYFGKLSNPNLDAEIRQYFANLAPPTTANRPQIKVSIPRSSASNFTYRPSNLAAHLVTRRRPLECWRELVVRTLRFGLPATLGKGVRLELQNVKVVIQEPVEEAETELTEYQFSLDAFRLYQRQILDPKLPENIAYSYGNRLRGYFTTEAGPMDTLDAAISLLRDDQESRHAYISLWHNPVDLASGVAEVDERSVPCLVTLFFRKIAGRLTLTATYRSHNLLTAWLQNVYGLIAIQRYVSDAVGLERGPVTVVSHSLTIDPNSTRFMLARALDERWDRDDDIDPDTGKPVLREDPNGYFVVSIDEASDTIVAQHLYQGITIKRYEGHRPEEIERAVAADMAVSVTSHAMWLGRELARCEAELKRAQAKREAAQRSSKHEVI